MNNADKPINPTTAQFNQTSREMDFEYQAEYFTTQFPGLSKREHYAGLAMQAIIQKMYGNVSIERIISDSLEYADELLKQLETK